MAWIYLAELQGTPEARRKSKPDNIISGFDVCHDYGTIEDLFADDWELVPEPFQVKTVKTVKMAPALICYQGTYHVTSSLDLSEKDARSRHNDNDFVRWLIDTPYAIDVEVSFNDPPPPLTKERV
jgi:hypothetical protein